MNSNDVGIVVIGRNEGERLIYCLASVTSVAGNVVYVDSGSTDGSTTAAEKTGALVVRLDLSQPFTAARARNEGFAALKVMKPDIRFVQFIDGDCELAAGWIKVAAAYILNQKDVAVVCGRRRERYPEQSIYNRLCDIEWDSSIGETSVCGGDSLVRVEAFESVGGFRSELIAGEEPELCLRLREKGWKIWRLDCEMTRHDAAMTRFSQWWLRGVRSGYGYIEVLQLHRNSPLKIYERETIRAVVWGGLVPSLILLGTLLHPAAIVGTLIYPVQICRIALHCGATAYSSWAYGLFVMIAKFSELQGILRFFRRRLAGQAGKLIEYKQAS
jgi:glycosyltransferase involved in cell wall biosynthesis